MGTHSKWYTAIRNTDVASVGGKNASLGEMIATLSGAGVAVPDGFAIAAQAYWDLLEANGIKAQLVACMDRLDRKDLSNLKEVADVARALLLGAEWPQELEQNIRSAYRELAAVGITSVAVHSSAAAEDLPTASFAGRHESFLNISGEDALLEVCRRCFAPLFGERAIKYRQDMGFPDMKVALSIGVQHIVRSDVGGAGVIFTLEPRAVSGTWWMWWPVGAWARTCCKVRFDRTSTRSSNPPCAMGSTPFYNTSWARNRRP